MVVYTNTAIMMILDGNLHSAIGTDPVFRPRKLYGTTTDGKNHRSYSWGSSIATTANIIGYMPGSVSKRRHIL